MKNEGVRRMAFGNKYSKLELFINDYVVSRSSFNTSFLKRLQSSPANVLALCMD